MTTTNPPLTADRAEIVRALAAILEPGQVTELRALDVVTPTYRQPHTVSGYFDDPDALADAAVRLATAPGVYIVPNPVNRALLARANNRARDVNKRDALTSDKDIVGRRWLLIDCDADRPAGISSSDDEHDAALARAGEIRDSLLDEGWPEPIVADSGNGAHLMYRVELPTDDGGLVKRCLEALGERFDDGAVHIDQTVFNPARIWKLYGTPARKGDNTPERPHRLARLLSVPATLTVVPREMLEILAGQSPAEAATPNHPNGRTILPSTFDLDAFMSRHFPDAHGPTPYQGGRRWVLRACAWDPSHTDHSAWVIEWGNGAIAAGCSHNSCQGRGWRDLRQTMEPGCYDPKPGSGAPLPQTAPGATEWETPVPFFVANLPPFPTDALPDWWAEFVEAEAIATQTPTVLAGMLTLAAVATACAKKVEVEVRAGWREPVNVFTAIALGPGNRKTAVVRDVAEPLEAWERAEAERCRPEIAEAQARRKVAESRLQQLQSQAAKANPEEADALVAEVAELAREVASMRVPSQPRLLADDCTPEKLSTLLAEQGGRMAVLTAEGDVFDLMAGRYGNGANFGVFLRGHAGDNLRVDRVGRPPEFVEEPALTLGLAVQPDVIRGLVEQPGFRGRGLLARFLYAWPEDSLGRRAINPPAVPVTTRTTYWRALRALLALPTATDEQGQPVAHRLRLASDAHRRLIAFETRVEPQLGAMGEMGAIPDWGAKLAGAVVRIAGLLHMARYHADAEPWLRPITEPTVQAAIRIGEYLIPHARASFIEMGSDETIEDAKHLLAWLERAGVDRFTQREAHYANRGRFKDAEQVAAALSKLEAHGYVRECEAEERPGRGRKPGPTYEVNPDAFRANFVQFVHCSEGDSPSPALAGEEENGSYSRTLPVNTRNIEQNEQNSAGIAPDDDAVNALNTEQNEQNSPGIIVAGDAGSKYAEQIEQNEQNSAGVAPDDEAPSPPVARPGVAPDAVAAVLREGECRGWPALQAGPVMIAGGETAWRAFAEFARAEAVVAVLNACLADVSGEVPA